MLKRDSRVARRVIAGQSLQGSCRRACVAELWEDGIRVGTAAVLRALARILESASHLRGSRE